MDSDGTSGATAVEQSIYVYEAGQIVAQFDKTGTGDLAATDMSHRYLWSPQAVDQLFADEQVHYDGGQGDFVTDDLFWALTDQLNSVRDLAAYNAGTDETTIALHRVFDAFGNETSATGAPRVSSVTPASCSTTPPAYRTTGTAGMTPRSASGSARTRRSAIPTSTATSATPH